MLVHMMAMSVEPPVLVRASVRHLCTFVNLMRGYDHGSWRPLRRGTGDAIVAQ